MFQLPGKIAVVKDRLYMFHRCSAIGCLTNFKVILQMTLHMDLLDNDEKASLILDWMFGATEHKKLLKVPAISTGLVREIRI